MTDYAEFLYEAYASEFGVVIETDNPELLRQKLYTIRKENPELGCLSLVISPINGVDLWIIKQGGSGA